MKYLVVFKSEIGKVRGYLAGGFGMMFCLNDIMILLDYEKAENKMSKYQKRYKVKGHEGLTFVKAADAADMVDRRQKGKVDEKTKSLLLQLTRKRKGWVLQEEVKNG